MPVIKKSSWSKSAPSPVNESVEDVCQDFGLEEVQIAYTAEDFENWTTKPVYIENVRPRVVEENPTASNRVIQRLLVAMWNEFVLLNPFIGGNEEEGDEVSGDGENDSEEEEAAEAAEKDDDAGSDVMETECIVQPKAPRAAAAAGGKLTVTKRRGAGGPTGSSKTSASSERSVQPVLRERRSKTRMDDGVDGDDTSDRASGGSTECSSDRPRRKSSQRKSAKRGGKRSRGTALEEAAESSDGAQVTRSGRPRRSAAIVGRKKIQMFEEEEGGEEESDEDWQQRQGFSGSKSDSENEDRCAECHQGGEIMLCDKCTRGYHLECLDPPLDHPPSGNWYCPRCKAGRPVLVKHDLNTARMSKAQGRVAPPLPFPVDKILNWRWHADAEAEAKAKSISPIEVEYPREFFVKFKERSYWACDWVTEIQMEVSQPATLRGLERRFGPLTVPPELEEDVSTTRRRKHRTADDSTVDDEPDEDDLERRYYRYGIQPEWLIAHRVLATRKSGSECLVKWRDRGYDEVNWELVTQRHRFPELDRCLSQYQARMEMFGENGGAAPGTQPVPPEMLFKPKMRKILGQLREQLTSQPSYLAGGGGGQLHPYQLEGLNWIRFSYANRVNTILADEMGLGKTIQAIAFLYGLWKEGFSSGPFLISAPLSTLINWEREFEFWAPDFVVVNYSGLKDVRGLLRDYELTTTEGMACRGSRPGRVKPGATLAFHVMLTSYDMVSVDYCTLQSIHWAVLIIDEAHRLKNNQSKFFRVMSKYNIEYKLLLTGTPLQNNLEELFNLLSFMEPGKFGELDDFQEEFAEISQEEQVKKLHSMLRTHLLRRLKVDVLKNMPPKSELIVRVDMTPTQKKCYKSILARNYLALCGDRSGLDMAGPFGNRPLSLITIMMNLRKCCNHPYSFPAYAQQAPRLPNKNFEGSGMIRSSGKLELLAKMLKKLKESKHRVLIFSQFTTMLDLLEDFMDSEGHQYERIDGKISGHERQKAIDRFNAPDSDSFVFLLSTRAGGLGINLATADTVIIYDSDWNPHNDIQAFSRAHRIGQKNRVMIYRFVCRNTVEERILQVCKKKMMLTHLVVRSGFGEVGGSKKEASLSKQEVEDILKFGAETLFKEGEAEAGGIVYDDEAVIKLLDRSQVIVAEKEVEAAGESDGTSGGLNDYLSSFKVAHYEVRDNPAEVAEEEEEEEREKEKEKEKAKEKSLKEVTMLRSNVDLDAGSKETGFWDRLLRRHYESEFSEVRETLGKGRRNRKVVNYEERKLNSRSRGEVGANAAGIDWTLDDSSDESEDDGRNGSGEEDYARQVRPSGQAPAASEGAVKPPLKRLMVTKHGYLEIAKFTPRDRKHMVESIMRYGLPAPGPLARHWLAMELRWKSEADLRNYIDLFLRHLVDPDASNPFKDKYSDGVPKEGLSVPLVLSRIAIMAMIRRKVVQYEQINGYVSLPLTAKQQSPPTVVELDGDEKKEEEGPRKESIARIDEPIDVDAVVEKPPSTHSETKSATTGGLVNGDNGVEDEPMIIEPTNPSSEENLPAAAPLFEFDIWDGGLTELHTFWSHEERELERQLASADSRNQSRILWADMWTRRHDYWLLAGVISHGYSRWSDLMADTRFGVITRAFVGRPVPKIFSDLHAYKLRFLSSRLRLLEQALMIEEQLIRVAWLIQLADEGKMQADLVSLSAQDESTPVMASRLAAAQKLHTTLLAMGSKKVLPVPQGPLSNVINQAMIQLHELLMDMKYDAPGLPASITVEPRPPAHLTQVSPPSSDVILVNMESQQTTTAPDGVASAPSS